MNRSSRRQMLRMTAMLGGEVFAQRPKLLALDTPGTLGAPLGPYGERSPFATTLSAVKMSNRDGFIADPRPDVGPARKPKP